jgi:MOSC domain-containing protein YiiM
LLKDLGLEDDAHAGPGIRQVSLLALESIRAQQGCKKVQAKGIELAPGDFGENVTTAGLVLHTMPLGTRLRIGATVVLEISKIGKECHGHCAIYHQTGDCIMPREGVFAVVVTEGVVNTGDVIEVLHA